MFVDADDWVDSGYVEFFLNAIQSNQAELVFNKTNYYISDEKSSDTTYKVDSLTATEWIYNDEIFVVVWNKIYSKELIKNNSIRFSEDIWHGEGMLFNIECIPYVDEVGIIEK